MKKLKISCSIALSLLLAVSAAACGERLEKPSELSVDEENLLTWREIDGARGYVVSVLPAGEETADEETVRRNSFSLSSLQEGDYEIKVLAVGGSGNSLRSEWSDPISFSKLRETGVVYELNSLGTEYSVKDAGAASGTIVIEKEYRGKPVTAIADAAFRACGRVEQVVVGENVRTIGANAFYQCPRLTSVEIPDSVVSIGTSAFQGCTSLSSVRLPSDLNEIADNTFAYCTSLKEIALGDSLVSIGNAAFLSTQLGEVTIPDSVISIGTRAFASVNDDASMLRVSFGRGLVAIGERAFGNRRALEELEFAETEELFIGERAFQDCISLREVSLSKGLKELGAYAFYGCKSLASVSLPEGLTAIDAYAFGGCTALDDVEIPDSVTAIGEYAFRSTALYARQIADESGFVYADDWLVAVSQSAKETLVNLTDEQFKPNVVGIAVQTFSACPELTIVNLPATVKYLGGYAFSNCPKLFSFITKESGSMLETIGDGAFANCGALANIRLRAGLKEIGNMAFANCLTVTNNEAYPYLLVPETVEHIGQNAFYGTDLWGNPKPENGGVIYAGKWAVGYSEISQSEIALIEDLEGVADYAFSGCDTITGVQNLHHAAHIGQGAFSGCVSLSSVTLSRTLEKIEPATFYNCSSLFSVGSNLPRDLASVGELAFAACSQLNAMDFSVTKVTDIGQGAFYGCSGLETLAFSDELETIEPLAFFLCSALQTLVFPDSVKTIGNRSFGWCQSLTSVSFGAGLESVGAFAFRNCTALEKIVLPAGVKTVGDYAFFRCTAVKEVSLSEGLEEIGACAFSGLVSLTEISLPASLKYIGENAFRDCMQLGSVIMRGEIGYIGAHAFYKCFNMTVYAATPRLSSAAWHEDWNSSYRPVLWDSRLAEDGSVLSVTVSSESVSNPYSRFSCCPPVREGYEFLGWATSRDASAPEYDEKNWRDAPEGTVLYALYTEAAEEQGL